MDELQAMKNIPSVFKMKCLVIPSTSEICFLKDSESDRCYDVEAQKWLESTPLVCKALKERDLYQSDIPCLLRCNILSPSESEVLRDAGLIVEEAKPILMIAEDIVKFKAALQNTLAGLTHQDDQHPEIQPLCSPLENPSPESKIEQLTEMLKDGPEHLSEKVE
jgi:hypothetical protein